ncbi:NusA N-terminal domain-containing protein [Metamycoplasma hyosynoviae]|uniref:NusA N-terminal domain-containing protein n=1 Tax=Metamycoplasma hyosynoviae TaxID=29559 RepID=UPI002366685D|nr:NusA N-terminal domain-containing protein [Metamycoplasma hyosynoviae]MDD7894134.1 NusA N-terminal domain-containing protein [Metamycoplasma hyosynoviae]
MEKDNKKIKEIFKTIYNLSELKKIPQDVLLNFLKNSIEQAFFEIYDSEAKLEFAFDANEKKFSITNHSKQVIEDPTTPYETEQLKRCIEIPLKQALEINPKAEIGDEISEEVSFDLFTKRDYEKINSIFKTLIIEYEKEKIAFDYERKVGQIVKATITSFQKNGILLQLCENENVSAYMPNNLTNKKLIDESKAAEIIDVCIIGTISGGKNAHILVTNANDKILINLLNKEIPEIANGIIEVVNISRIAGSRTKIAVRKTSKASSSIEEVGSIIGRNGQRIENISNQLNGEKIDVFQFSEDKKTLIINALSPAKIFDIIQDRKAKSKLPTYTVITPNEHNLIAIGKKGQNVILAGDIANCRLDIISEEEAAQRQIIFNPKNGNITDEELEEIKQGKRLHNQNRRPFKKQSERTLSIDLDDFANEIAELRSEIQSTNFENRILGSDEFNADFQAALNKVHTELNAPIKQHDDDIYSGDKKTKKTEEKDDYDKIAKNEMKDFKQDDDLLSGINIGDINDEDWE